MTTEETAKAHKHAEPKTGEVLVYIDHTGAKLFGPENQPKTHKVHAKAK